MIAQVLNSEGKLINPQSVIVPILRVDLENGTKIKGTAFFIGVNGVLMTAKHTVLDQEGNVYQNLSVLHFVENGKYFRRNISNIIIYDDLDIAYLFLETMTNNKDGSMLTNPILSITEVQPAIDEKIVSYGYPMNLNWVNNEIEGKIIIELNPEFVYGRVIGYQNEPTFLLKHPSIHTNLNLVSGISGGPVFGANGAVCAINSSGIEPFEEEDPIAFVSPLWMIFDFKLNLDNDEKLSIRELGMLNRISVV